MMNDIVIGVKLDDRLQVRSVFISVNQKILPEMPIEQASGRTYRNCTINNQGQIRLDPGVPKLDILDHQDRPIPSERLRALELENLLVDDRCLDNITGYMFSSPLIAHPLILMKPDLWRLPSMLTYLVPVNFNIIMTNQEIVLDTHVGDFYAQNKVVPQSLML